VTGLRSNQLSSFFKWILHPYFKKRLEPNSRLAPLTSIVGKKNTLEVNGAKHLFGSNRSTKHLPLCSAEERFYCTLTLENFEDLQEGQMFVFFF